MKNRVRFAPSPTGYLHVGNVRTALVNWLFARKTGGEFWLRIDDTDTERSKSEYETAIKEDLSWLGLTWDTLEKQSSRMGRYKEAVDQLIAKGRLYPCYETAEELEIKRKMLASRGLPPIYDRSALKLTDAEKQKYEAEGKKPHWRFLLEAKDITWNDLIRGEQKFNGAHLTDPVLIREDGVPLYTLASVVDDGDMHMTHVIRGEDHVSNTAVQIQIFEALAFAVPQFAHMALLKTKEGELSKRVGGNDIRGMRESGILPMAINALLARMGTSLPVEAFGEITPLVETFDWKHFGRAQANYDAEELKHLNAKILHQLSFASVKAQLPAQLDEGFWLSVRGNISALSDAADWWRILHEPVHVDLNHDERAFLREASHLLPAEPWDASTWDAWLSAIKPATTRKGKELFMPLRKALTGMEHGPELKVLLPLLGFETTKKRLS